MNHCYEFLNLAGKLFTGRSYARVFIEFEPVNAAVGLMNWMRQNFLPTDEINLFIAQILNSVTCIQIHSYSLILL